MSQLLEYLCPLSVRSIEIFIYLTHYIQWDQEKCLLNGGVRLIECLLQEILLYYVIHNILVGYVIEK